MQFGLEETAIDEIRNILKKFSEIRLVLIYGSRAKGNYKPGSDIDLTIKNSPIDFQRMNQLRSELDDLNTPYSFDISIFEELNSSDLIEHINRVGVVFYEL